MRKNEKWIKLSAVVLCESFTSRAGSHAVPTIETVSVEPFAVA